MMKSKIPLPNKRAAQSSIPVPTKYLGVQTKKLPLNSKETLESKKPVSEKALSKSSKVGEKHEKNVKRLPPKSQDYKKVAQLSVKPSSKTHNTKGVATSTSKPLTENKLIKQAKLAPVKQLSRSIPPRLKSAEGKENQPKKFSSFNSNNDKKAGVFGKSTTKNKLALQPKIANQTKKLAKISTISLKEEANKNLSVPEKARNVTENAPPRPKNLATKSGVDDSDFKESQFFKSLILNQRELSPGIIKMCSESKSSSGLNANLLKPQQQFSVNFQSAAEFVEEVKRNSSKYYRLNGKLVPYSPRMLKRKEKSVEDFVEEVKRNSGRFLQRKGNLISSPCLASKNSSVQGVAQDLFSVKKKFDFKILDDVRRLSEFRRQNSQNSDSLMESRRWTCNVPTKPSIVNMNTSELAAEMQKLSEIRRESGAQLLKKVTFLEYQHSAEKLNPHQKALRDLESLTAKKKEKIKKKVTFLIPSPGSLNSATVVAAKTETKLSDISESSSQNCTPELNLDNCKVATNSQSGDSGVNNEDTSVITTPELVLTTYKLNFNSSPKELNATLPFNMCQKIDKLSNNSSDNQTLASEKVKDTSKINTEESSQNCTARLFNSETDFLSKFSSLQINCNNVLGSELTSFENLLMDTDSNSYSEFSKLKSTDCLFQSVHRLAVPSNYRTVNETENFCVNSERKIYTPHPVALNKSNLSSSVSPSFLSRKFTTLNSHAPICTPFVLKSLAHSPDGNLSDVRQKLDFNEKPNLTMERRESQIILQTIPTVQKMNDFLCDQECIILSSQSSEEEIFFRNLKNPIASILNNGDEMHFIPIYSP